MIPDHWENEIFAQEEENHRTEEVEAGNAKETDFQIAQAFPHQNGDARPGKKQGKSAKERKKDGRETYRRDPGSFLRGIDHSEFDIRFKIGCRMLREIFGRGLESTCFCIQGFHVSIVNRKKQGFPCS
jgi:hypothetical protein